MGVISSFHPYTRVICDVWISRRVKKYYPRLSTTTNYHFKGYQVWVWGTIPAGVGSNLVDFSIDGGTPNVTSRTSNGSAVYNEQYYASPLLRETYHTIVVTNRGSNANGNTEFQLDRFQFETSDDTPLFTPSGVSATPTSLPSSSATGSSGGATLSGGSKTPIGAITGAVIGALTLIIMILVYLLWRRRKRDGEDSSNNEKTSTTSRNCTQLFSLPALLTNIAPQSSPIVQHLSRHLFLWMNQSPHLLIQQQIQYLSPQRRVAPSILSPERQMWPILQ